MHRMQQVQSASTTVCNNLSLNYDILAIFGCEISIGKHRTIQRYGQAIFRFMPTHLQENSYSKVHVE
jgi:hypothetical protein